MQQETFDKLERRITHLIHDEEELTPAIYEALGEFIRKLEATVESKDGTPRLREILINGYYWSFDPPAQEFLKKSPYNSECLVYSLDDLENYLLLADDEQERLQETIDDATAELTARRLEQQKKYETLYKLMEDPFVETL